MVAMSTDCDYLSRVALDARGEFAVEVWLQRLCGKITSRTGRLWAALTIECSSAFVDVD